MIPDLYDSGFVKRNDLQLRLKYYGLKTKIYLIEPNHYAIQILNYYEMFGQIKNYFDKNIRIVGSWIELVKDKPINAMSEVKPITNLACTNEGLFLNQKMFESLLVSRFPDINFKSISVEHTNGIVIRISVGFETNSEDISALKAFIMDMKLAFTDVIVEKINLLPEATLYIDDVCLACTDKKFKFSVDDSDFWFSNVEKIYESKVLKEDLRFFDKNKTKCYFDFSVWENTSINIRSAAMLYDTIYISFPLEGHFEDFLRQQHLTLSDLEALVERNKLIILLPNTESRYEKAAIERLYQINNNSIVSKRGINALMAIYYCEMEEKYMSFWNGHESELEAFCMDCMKTKDDKQKVLLDLLLWPVRAKANSYELLTSYGPMRLPSIGVNTIFDCLTGGTESTNIMNFELTVNSNAIHFASALQATYFPFCTRQSKGEYSDAIVSNILGGILNSYQYWGKHQRESIERYREVLDNERSAIYLLRPDNKVNLKHIIDYAEKYNTPHTLKNILRNLVNLDEKERNKKLEEYSNLIAEIGEEKPNKEKTLNYVLSGISFIPAVGEGASIINLLLQVIKDFKLKDKWMLNRIEADKASKEEEVYLLDKLSRVARIE